MKAKTQMGQMQIQTTWIKIEGKRNLLYDTTGSLLTYACSETARHD